MRPRLPRTTRLLHRAAVLLPLRSRTIPRINRRCPRRQQFEPRRRQPARLEQRINLFLPPTSRLTTQTGRRTRLTLFHLSPSFVRSELDHGFRGRCDTCRTRPSAGSLRFCGVKLPAPTRGGPCRRFVGCVCMCMMRGGAKLVESFRGVVASGLGPSTIRAGTGLPYGRWKSRERPTLCAGDGGRSASSHDPADARDHHHH
jgi:hypothetical protein